MAGRQWPLGRVHLIETVCAERKGEVGHACLELHHSLSNFGACGCLLTVFSVDEVLRFVALIERNYAIEVRATPLLQPVRIAPSANEPLPADPLCLCLLTLSATACCPSVLLLAVSHSY